MGVVRSQAGSGLQIKGLQTSDGPGTMVLGPWSHPPGTMVPPPWDHGPAWSHPPSNEYIDRRICGDKRGTNGRGLDNYVINEKTVVYYLLVADT